MNNKKRLLCIAILTILAATAYAQQYDPESDFQVKKISDGKSVAITKYVGSKQIVRIPPTFQGLPVTLIGYEAFGKCTSLINVTIPDSVTTIGQYAFFYCTNLTSVTIPNGIIDYMAFRSCISLTSVTIGIGVTDIGEYAFGECTSLTSVIIPKSVKSIEQFAFGDCTKLTSVTFHGNIHKDLFGCEYDYEWDWFFEGESPFLGDLKEKYLAGGPGTYTTTAPVNKNSKWTKK